MSVADPAVSRRKFEREVGQLRAIENTLVSRGWWLMAAAFPFVKVGFATANLRPVMIPFAVRADFTEYDVLPLAIAFVDPFTDRELMPVEMMTKLRRLLPAPPAAPDEPPPAVRQVVELYQHYGQFPQSPGFLCLPGTRAYHAHPGHTGDPWELHRATGEGKLIQILETIWRYGTAPLDHITIGLGQMQVSE